MGPNEVLLSVVVAGSGTPEMFRRSIQSVRRNCRNVQSIEVLCLVHDNPDTESRLRATADCMLIPLSKSAQVAHLVRGRFIQFLQPGHEVSPVWFRLGLLAFRRDRVGAVRGIVEADRQTSSASCNWLLPRSILSGIPGDVAPFHRNFGDVIHASVRSCGWSVHELNIPMTHASGRGPLGWLRAAYLDGRACGRAATGPGEACLLAPVGRPIRLAALWALLLSATILYPPAAGIVAVLYLLHTIFSYRALRYRLSRSPALAEAMLAPARVLPEGLGVFNGLRSLWRGLAGRESGPAASLPVATCHCKTPSPRYAYLSEGVSLS